MLLSWLPTWHHLAHWSGWPFDLTTIVALIGLVIAIRELNASKRATQLAASIDLLREYRSKAMREARMRIHAFDYDNKQGFGQFNTADREAAELISHYLDNVGILVESKYLNPQAASRFLGGSAVGMWEELGPFIRAERDAQGRDETYQRYFESLVYTFGRMPYLEAIGVLPTRRSDPGVSQLRRVRLWWSYAKKWGRRRSERRALTSTGPRFTLRRPTRPG